jgi:hypothetical protein
MPDDSYVTILCEPATPTKDGTARWRFMCPHCKGYHFHSASPGHRHAHCHDPSSPFTQDGGYILRLRPQPNAGRYKLTDKGKQDAKKLRS